MPGKAVIEGSSDSMVLDFLPYPVAVADANLVATRLNSAWIEAFGGEVDLREVLGDSLCVALNQRAQGDVVDRIKIGAVGYEVHATLSPDGWVILLQNREEAIHREEADRRNIEWYRRALQAAGEGSWEFDIQEGRCSLSGSLKEKLGFSAADYVSTQEVLELIYPDDRDIYLTDRASAIAGQGLLHCEVRMCTPIGYRWFLISGAVLRDGEGVPLRIAGLVVDIHERKVIEEQLRELNRALESKVADRTRELAQTNEELQSFCYSVSHDLRGPLRSINGFGKALEEEYGHLFDAQGRDYLQRIRKAAIRLSGLIDGLLNLARITQAGMKREPLDIAEISSELLEDLCRTYPERKTKISIQTGLKTYGDLNLVRLALANLIENAWKFSSNSELTWIEVGLEGEAYYVRDHGAGFNMEYAAKLFAPFERLHTESEFPGSGLGLAVVQRVVQRHHGAVWAEGEPGVGATVFFTLPSRKRDRKNGSAP